jgi:hypothetical protein
MRSTVLPAIAFVFLSLASPAKADSIDNCVFLRAAREARGPDKLQPLCSCIVGKYRQLMSPGDFAIWEKYEQTLTLGLSARQVSEALDAHFVEKKIPPQDGNAAIIRILDAMKKVPDTDCQPK